MAGGGKSLDEARIMNEVLDEKFIFAVVVDNSWNTENVNVTR